MMVGEGGRMVPMEIAEPRPTQPTSLRRWALVLCLTVVPIAFSAAGLTLTFPAAEIAYEIEAAIPNSGQKATESATEREQHRGDDVVATLLTEGLSQGLAEVLTQEEDVAPHKLTSPAAEIPSGDVGHGSAGGEGAPQAEPAAAAAAAAAHAPDEITRERARVQERERERAAEREKATERERETSATNAGVAGASTETTTPTLTAPIEMDTQRDRETERQRGRDREPRAADTPAPPKLRRPGCSHPPALRDHGPWTAADRCGTCFPLPCNFSYKS